MRGAVDILPIDERVVPCGVRGLLVNTIAAFNKEFP